MIPAVLGTEWPETQYCGWNIVNCPLLHFAFGLTIPVDAEFCRFIWGGQEMPRRPRLGAPCRGAVTLIAATRSASRASAQPHCSPGVQRAPRRLRCPCNRTVGGTCKSRPAREPGTLTFHLCPRLQHVNDPVFHPRGLLFFLYLWLYNWFWRKCSNCISCGIRLWNPVYIPFSPVHNKLS